jgi:type I restriction enzyme M protein
MAELAAGATNATTARIVWDTADKFLRDVVEPEDYGDYILPFTVLRRLECMLVGSKEQVTKFVASLGDLPPHLIDIAVKDRFKLSFYNVSPLDLPTIASVDDNVEKSLQNYISGFSQNIADIWVSFEFARRAKILADSNRLHAVVKHFSTIDLSPGKFENTAMGDVFEDVMYRAFNKKGKAAGAFYTPRDAIKLMVDILITNDDDTLAGDSALRSIYDPTAGSGGMLLIAQDALRRMNEKIDVTLYGQELCPRRSPSARPTCSSRAVGPTRSSRATRSSRTSTRARPSITCFPTRRSVKTGPRTRSPSASRPRGTVRGSATACRASVTARCYSWRTARRSSAPHRRTARADEQR